MGRCCSVSLSLLFLIIHLHTLWFINNFLTKSLLRMRGLTRKRINSQPAHGDTFCFVWNKCLVHTNNIQYNSGEFCIWDIVYIARWGFALTLRRMAKCCLPAGNRAILFLGQHDGTSNLVVQLSTLASWMMFPWNVCVVSEPDVVLSIIPT